MKDGLFFTKTHEWVKKIDDSTILTGLSEHAVKEMGDIVFINLPEAGNKVVCKEPYTDVESVKAVSDVYSPVDGVIAQVNTELFDKPEKFNESPYDAWIARMSDVTATIELMDEEEYEEYIK